MNGVDGYGTTRISGQSVCRLAQSKYVSVNPLDRTTISVAIPVCGQAEFLSSAMKSLAAQGAELKIAVLDATPDDSVQRILQENFGLQIDYVRHGPDDGQAAAIQEGWDQLDGGILHWLNADDYLLPSAIEAVKAVFDSRPDVDVVYGDAVFVDRDGTFTGYFPAISDKPGDLVKTCCIAQPACFVRRRAVDMVGGLNTTLHYIMDWDLWTRLYVAGAGFHYLRRPLACVRMYPETKTGSGADARLREIREHLRKYAGVADGLKSMAAFMASSGGNGGSVVRKGLRYVKQGHRKWRQALARSGLGRPVRELYGLESHTNRVKTSAEVWLPWYEDRSPRELAVITQGCGELAVDINGFSAAAMGQNMGARGKETVFALPPGLQNERLLRIRLHDRHGLEWRLQSVRLR